MIMIHVLFVYEKKNINYYMIIYYYNIRYISKIIEDILYSIQYILLTIQYAIKLQIWCAIALLLIGSCTKLSYVE